MLLPIICWLFALFFILMGVVNSRSKKPAGIYSNVKAPNAEELINLKAYNKAVGRLVMGYGLLQAVTGILIIPLKQRSGGNVMVFSLFFGAILMMIIYEIVISPKYHKKHQGKGK